MGGGRIFLKSLREASFNKDLSNEPTFSRSILLDSTFKGLLQAGGWGKFAENVCASPFSQETTFSQIH